MSVKVFLVEKFETLHKTMYGSFIRFVFHRLTRSSALNTIIFEHAWWRNKPLLYDNGSGMHKLLAHLPERCTLSTKLQFVINYHQN